MPDKDKISERIKDIPFRKADGSTLYLTVADYLRPNELEDYVAKITQLLLEERLDEAKKANRLPIGEIGHRMQYNRIAELEAQLKEIK